MRKSKGNVRLASWNIRWFPDGHPASDHDPERRIDTIWLACALAWLDADVVVLQEIKGTPRARRALGEIVARLSRRGAGEWRFRTDGCDTLTQHIAFLWNTSRVSAGQFRRIRGLHPSRRECGGRLRPGFGGYFKHAIGASFHLIGVHAKSGVGERDFDLRDRSLRGLSAAFRSAQGHVRDSDVIIAGDFNTIGCRYCPRPLSPAEELVRLDRAIASGTPAFRRLPAKPGCTQYYRGRGGLLDHFLVSNAMREVPESATVHVQGYCAQTGCRPLSRPPRAYENLSDHCPVLLDFPGRNLD